MSHSPVVDRRRSGTRESGLGRRRYPRVVLALEGFYDSEQRSLHLRDGNLSLRGIFVASSAPDPAGGEAVVRLEVPGSPVALRLSGRVVWADEDRERGPAGMGIRFSGLSTWQLKRLAAVLLQRAGWRGILSDIPPPVRQLSGGLDHVTL